MRTVLFVGAGRHQRRAILRAKELGLRVVGVDRNPDALGLAEAHVARIVDYADPSAVIDAVADLELDGVLTVSADSAVPAVAAVAEARGLPGIGTRTAHLMTHKVAMRQRLAEAGVPQPRFAALEQFLEQAFEIGVHLLEGFEKLFTAFLIEGLDAPAQTLDRAVEVGPVGLQRLKPLLVLFTLPFILITMGLGVLVINALLFMLVGRLVQGFHVAGFWPAVGGSLVVSLTNLLVTSFVRSRASRPAPPPPRLPEPDPG